MLEKFRRKSKKSKKNGFIVYRKGDIVREPMISRDVLPKNVPGVGCGGVGWVM